MRLLNPSPLRWGIKALLATLSLALLAACGSTSTPSSGPPSSTPGATTLATANTSLGTVLTSPTGYTLYYFLPERNATLGACDAVCLTTWPPLTATLPPASNTPLPGTLGTVALANGSKQETYNGWPLHIYSGDNGPAQTNGNGIDQMWFAITPTTTGLATGTLTSPTPAPAATPASSSAVTPGPTPSPYTY